MPNNKEKDNYIWQRYNCGEKNISNKIDIFWVK